MALKRIRSTCSKSELFNDTTVNIDQSFFTNIISKTEGPEYEEFEEVIKTKYPNTVPYHEVCPASPPYVPSAIVGIMEELEKRIPPLTELKIPKTCNFDKAESNVDNLISQGPEIFEMPAYLHSDKTYILMQTLLLFLQRLSHAPFRTSAEFITMVHKFAFSIDCHPHLPLLEKNLITIFNTLNQTEMAIFTYMMGKLGLFMKINAAYELERNPDLNIHDIHCEATSFLASLFATGVINLPSTFGRSGLKELKTTESQVKNLIFKILCGSINPTLWHELNIKIYDEKFKANLKKLVVTLPILRSYSSKGITWH